METSISSLVNATTMSSLEIAEVANKQHRHVLEAIRRMEPAWKEVTGSKFGLSEYTDSTGRKLPMYSLTKTECLYIATKFNDKARARLILRWEELEMQAAGACGIPGYALDTVEKLHKALLDAQETIDRQNDVIDEKSRIIADMERMASLLEPDHKSFTSSVDFQFVVDCMTRLLRLELVKAERVEDMERRITTLERLMREKGGEI
ncbi:Rha family transcriptional regulator [uncultured Duncaniella sp.]|jgi:phage regulator Rha-like protein|uniref:Rha family transcriptional regulator n=2 Tax=uncultured Duncaniella sp. TaxID=2768039 RepID=UPI0025B2260C|nr:Rha family transcriptional regulator [uncultured Duncaniella sp.]